MGWGSSTWSADDSAGRLADELAEGSYADVELLLTAVRDVGSANVIHLATMIKADLFVMPDTPFGHAEMARRIRLPLLGDGLPLVCIASAEDMVLQKLRWFRATGERSDRQWTDVLGILRVQGAALDFDYLERWAIELEVGDLLVRAIG